MLFPVRCFTCNKVTGHLWQTYDRRTTNGEAKDAVLDSMNIHRYCCRRMFLTHVELIDDLLLYEDPDEGKQNEIARCYTTK